MAAYLVCEVDIHHSAKLAVCKVLGYMGVLPKLVNGLTLDLFELVEFSHAF